MPMKTLYFDCFSGISGDMTIGALLDLGLEFDHLRNELSKVNAGDYELKVSRVVRANLSAMKFDVVVHEHSNDRHHRHDHDHGPHRKASEILRMISLSSLSANAKRRATEIFMKLAISEGKVHHVAPEDVSFHEVGAVDSIVDVVGAAIGFDALEIGKFRCSPINVGAGFIHCQHGVYPVPSPATADLLTKATIYSKHVETELVTPTGAAILAAVVDDFGPLSGFVMEKSGYGAGTKQFGSFPNCLRLFLGEEGKIETPPLQQSRAGSFEEIMVLEANVDDMTPQNWSYVSERLLAAGALDVFTVPVYMKKGRPGQLLQVLAPENRIDALSEIVFFETTTIGLRMRPARRKMLDRESIRVETEHGPVWIKVSKLDGRVVNVVPEFEDCVLLARARQVPLKDIQASALKAYWNRQIDKE